MVGIEEACSGIRSLQASCMLALFFYVLYRLPKRRILLCLSGALAFSFSTNLLRTISLTTVAARCGINSMLRWHELTGTVSALACFSCVWFLAARLRNLRENRNYRGKRPDLSEGRIAGDVESGALPRRRYGGGPTLIKTTRVPMKLAIVLLGLVASAEFATWGWYGSRERDLPPAVTWHINAPREQQQLRELGMSDETRRLLRYDEGINLGWTDHHGLQWQAIFLHWNPGGAAGRLARNHTPGDCLAAAGVRSLAEGTQQVISAHGLRLPIRTYVARTERGLARVYYCLWEDRSTSRSFGPAYSTYAARLAAVLAGVRNSGQRSLELVVWNALSEREAEESVQTVLTAIIRTDR
jgi:exosortase/archaeosortase family protein